MFSLKLSTFIRTVPRRAISRASSRYPALHNPHPLSTMTTAAGKSLDTGHTFSSNGTSGHKQVNAWQQPGPAAYDFRSDTTTTPTESMLNAIINTTLLDDVTMEDPTTNALETQIAQMTSHEAALLVMSGTMGNQIALKTHLSLCPGPPFSILTDHRSHIYRYEAGAISNLAGAMLITVRPSNGHHLTLSDIETHCVISSDVHSCPTKVISLENTLNGTVMPLSEVRAISAFARQHDIILHLDGARIWEVAAATTHGTLSDFTSLFDSVSLCFSKGLGAPIGSIIVGSTPFINHARRTRKMLGGGTRQAGVLSGPARVAVDETFGSGQNGEGGKLRATHERAKRIADFWTSKGGELTDPVETNMVWLDLVDLGVDGKEFVKVLEKHGLRCYASRIVVHYQICDDAVTRLERAMEEVLGMKKIDEGRGAVVNGDGNGHAGGPERERKFDQYGE